MEVTKGQKPTVSATRCRVGVVPAVQGARYCGPEGSGLGAKAALWAQDSFPPTRL
ncbi:mCG1036084, isoform CRA_a [Mus musculus]|nr:mCG1036084, isoform CRA_a [Mus musculus]EDL11347.1 mCG1036084, isoform CRA_a [Mus musculus]